MTSAFSAAFPAPSQFKGHLSDPLEKKWIENILVNSEGLHKIAEPHVFQIYISERKVILLFSKMNNGVEQTFAADVTSAHGGVAVFGCPFSYIK